MARIRSNPSPVSQCSVRSGSVTTAAVRTPPRQCGTSPTTVPARRVRTRIRFPVELRSITDTEPDATKYSASACVPCSMNPWPAGARTSSRNDNRRSGDTSLNASSSVSGRPALIQPRRRPVPHPSPVSAAYSWWHSSVSPRGWSAAQATRAVPSIRRGPGSGRVDGCEPGASAQPIVWPIRNAPSDQGGVITARTSSIH